ncbi:predicted protein [Lichtheimia corymbifera JMRC:FSU:9682]|uniref:Uncharacterized protein n=1 Tax=Lichtheimia corymbifera JMRC:FSU:9682 TaxID=1263082 RepID=A0A068SDU1_9FUNG|nr:predicted protein [Lichtheimia corymbifera JMRC:FSU:9682]
MKQEHPASGSTSSSSSENDKKKSRIQWLPFLDERRHAMDQHQQHLGYYGISHSYMDCYTACDAWLEQQMHSPSSCSSSNSSSPSLSLANPRWGAETRHTYQQQHHNHHNHHQQHVPSLFETPVAPPLTPPQQHHRVMIDSSSSTCSTSNTPPPYYYHHHANAMVIQSRHPVKQQHHSASILPAPMQSSCISLPSIVDPTTTPNCNRRPFAFF